MNSQTSPKPYYIYVQYILFALLAWVFCIFYYYLNYLRKNNQNKFKIKGFERFINDERFTAISIILVFTAVVILAGVKVGSSSLTLYSLKNLYSVTIFQSILLFSVLFFLIIVFSSKNLLIFFWSKSKMFRSKTSQKIKTLPLKILSFLRRLFKLSKTGNANKKTKNSSRESKINLPKKTKIMIRRTIKFMFFLILVALLTLCWLLFGLPGAVICLIVMAGGYYIFNYG